MDPYLEAHWRDVHASLVIYARDALQEALPPELRARVEERVVLETPEGITGGLFPDVRVVESRPVQQRRAPGISDVAAETEEPILVATDTEPLTEGFIQIIDTSSGNRVVTVIEFLSPTNKTPGDGLEQYRRKQGELLRSDTSLVEIDLVRTGRHVLAVPLAEIPSRRRTPWMACVRRPWVRGKAEVYPLPIERRLPRIKVPLRQADADVPLDLQALIEQCYRRGRYEGDINYTLDPEPPLTGPDAEWADEMLRGQGLRPRKGKRKPPSGGSS
jgi:hypothetical protein